MNSPAAYPLAWPPGFPRTKSAGSSQFRTSLSGALENVRTSLVKFGSDSGKAVTDIVISSNVTLGVSRPADAGVAVWFVWEGESRCIAVDRYPKVEDNLQAIHHVLEARRTELRHGTLALVRAAFAGFKALPAPPGAKTWRDVLDFKPEDGPRINREAVEGRFRRLASIRHPDKSTGSQEAMAELNAARDEALREVG